jgi:hypothetical protein
MIMNWYCFAQFTDLNTTRVDVPLITVQPYEPIIQEAVDELMQVNPRLFVGVNQINVDMGWGQFGSVSSTDPADININLGKIKSEVASQVGPNFDESNFEHVAVLKRAIKRVIIHERGHVADYNPEQHGQGGDPFPGGEAVAEQAVTQWGDS